MGRKRQKTCAICLRKGHNSRTCPNRPRLNEQARDENEVIIDRSSLDMDASREGDFQLSPNINTASDVFSDDIVLHGSSDENSNFTVPQVTERAAHQIPGKSHTQAPVVFEHLPSEVARVGADDSIVVESEDQEFIEVEEINFHGSCDSDQDSQLNVEVDEGEQCS